MVMRAMSIDRRGFLLGSVLALATTPRSALGGTEPPGAGLGLAISREIVRAHGGTIRAFLRDGGGAEFAFTLPRAATGTAGASSQPVPSVPPESRARLEPS